MTENASELTEAERETWDCDPDEWPHTPPLHVYRVLESEDDNVFWRMQSGHTQNLLDAALDALDEATARAAALRDEIAREIEARMGRDADYDDGLEDAADIARGGPR